MALKELERITLSPSHLMEYMIFLILLRSIPFLLHRNNLSALGECSRYFHEDTSDFYLLITSYYGWIIVYGQLVDKVCKNYSLDYDELWKFAAEIHAFLGNRPKTYIDPKGIGGHCVP